MFPNKRELIRCFEIAEEHNFTYVIVRISADGVEESIVIPPESQQDKKEFYEGAYKDDLTHVMNDKVKIIRFEHVDDVNDWEF